MELSSSSDSAEAVRLMTKLMDAKDDISINMPCALMPVSTGEAAEFMHPRPVTYLKGYHAYYTRGVLIPHLTKKGFFWKSQAPAIHNAVLQCKLFIDGENAAHLEKLDRLECGHVPLLRWSSWIKAHSERQWALTSIGH